MKTTWQHRWRQLQSSLRLPSAIMRRSVARRPLPRCYTAANVSSCYNGYTHVQGAGLSVTTCICVGLQVEMVLQTYYHNLDNTYNKLQTIHEYMTDIEASTHYACQFTSTIIASPWALLKR